MKGKYSTETAIALLREKAQALKEAGETRCPCRGDFSEEEVVAIKAFLGPWPRALEQAGLKPVSHPEREIRRQAQDHCGQNRGAQREGGGRAIPIIVIPA